MTSMLFVLPTARRSSSFVDWEELRVIDTRVQQALDASKRTERHNEYEYV